MSKFELSAQMQEVVTRLQEDEDFVGLFMDDPDKALAGYTGLSEEEKRTLTARTADDMMRLGFGKEEKMPGAFSLTCSENCN